MIFGAGDSAWLERGVDPVLDLGAAGLKSGIRGGVASIILGREISGVLLTLGAGLPSPPTRGRNSLLVTLGEVIFGRAFPAGGLIVAGFENVFVPGSLVRGRCRFL